ncbi:MAG: hypothetical protein Q9167_007730 [Letrouitia subvulpina]
MSHVLIYPNYQLPARYYFPSIVHSSGLVGSHDLPRAQVVIQSAQQYAEEVVAHANTPSIASSLYPGRNYEPLAAFFKPFQPEVSENGKYETNMSVLPFAILHDLNLEKDDPLRVQKAVGDKQPPALLLFLRGYPSHGWLTSIGWKCDVDPEFFRRHLDFLSKVAEDNNYFTLPALPSTSTNIIRLRVSTIGHRQCDDDSNQRHLERLRQDSTRDMADYLKNLRHHNSFKVGHSIARSFAVFDQKIYAIEQDISICVNSFGKGWIGIAWLDNGYPLTLGPEGPWSKSIKPTYSWKIRFNPIIQHRPKIALKTKYMSTQAGMDPQPRTDQFPQSACQVPVHYGRFLSTSTSVADSFYAFSEIFTLVASSECQYLNMVEQKIKSEIVKVIGANERKDTEETEEQSSTLSNLIYYKTFLDEHIQRLKDNISSIQAQGDYRWPKASASGASKSQDAVTKQQEKATTSAQTLLKDFEYLLERAKTLSESCERGVDIAANNAMIAESRRAIQQAKRTVKLTILAFFFIPASFTTSLFGMNFKQFSKDNSLSIWIWFLVLIPTYVVSLVLLYNDVEQIKNQFVKTWNSISHGRLIKKL